MAIKNIRRRSLLEGRSATLTVAASNAADTSKAQADYVCDGVGGAHYLHDDYYINAAIAALNGTNTTGSVVLSEGIFYLSDEISSLTKHHVTLAGSGWGTQLTWATGTVATDKYMIRVGQSGAPLMRWCIKDMFLTGNSANVTGGSGILGYFASADITHVKVDDYNQMGITCSYQSAGVRITHCDVGSKVTAPSGCNDIYLDRCGDSFISHNLIGSDLVSGTAYGIRVAGVGADPTQSIIITDNYFNQNTFHIYGSDCQNLLIDNNIFNCADQNNIYIDNSTVDIETHGISITHNIFSGWAEANAATCYAISIIPRNNSTYKCTDLLIDGNRFDADPTPTNAQSVMNFNYADRYTDCKVINNHLWGFTSNAIDAVPTSGMLFQNNSGYIAPGEVRTASGALVPTGTCTATTATGVFTESPAALKPGVNTLHCTTSGTLSVVIPTGSTAVATSGDAIVTDSPKACPAGTTVVTVTTGAGADDFTITVTPIAFAWHNPEAQDIYIKKVVLNRSAAGGTATSELEVGIADDAVATNRGTEFFNALDLNAAACVHDSLLAAGTSFGTQDRWVLCQDSASATDGWVVGEIKTEIANTLAGSYYIEYVGK